MKILRIQKKKVTGVNVLATYPKGEGTFDQAPKEGADQRSEQTCGRSGRGEGLPGRGSSHKWEIEKLEGEPVDSKDLEEELNLIPD